MFRSSGEGPHFTKRKKKRKMKTEREVKQRLDLEEKRRGRKVLFHAKVDEERRT